MHWVRILISKEAGEESVPPASSLGTAPVSLGMTKGWSPCCFSRRTGIKHASTRVFLPMKLNSRMTRLLISEKEAQQSHGPPTKQWFSPTCLSSFAESYICPHQQAFAQSPPWKETCQRIVNKWPNHKKGLNQSLGNVTRVQCHPLPRDGRNKFRDPPTQTLWY